MIEDRSDTYLGQQMSIARTYSDEMRKMAQYPLSAVGQKRGSLFFFPADEGRDMDQGMDAKLMDHCI